MNTGSYFSREFFEMPEVAKIYKSRFHVGKSLISNKNPCGQIAIPETSIPIFLKGNLPHIHIHEDFVIIKMLYPGIENSHTSIVLDKEHLIKELQKSERHTP
jgi:hypothetical protein